MCGHVNIGWYFYDKETVLRTENGDRPRQRDPALVTPLFLASTDQPMAASGFALPSLRTSFFDRRGDSREIWNPVCVQGFLVAVAPDFGAVSGSPFRRLAGPKSEASAEGWPVLDSSENASQDGPWWSSVLRALAQLLLVIQPRTTTGVVTLT